MLTGRVLARCMRNDTISSSRMAGSILQIVHDYFSSRWVNVDHYINNIHRENKILSSNSMF